MYHFGATKKRNSCLPIGKSSHKPQRFVDSVMNGRQRRAHSQFVKLPYKGTSTMTRFAIRDAIYRAIWCLQCSDSRFAMPPRFAICDLCVYNESDVANRKSPAIHRKSPMCLQCRDLRRDTRFATSLLEMKKSFIFSASRDLALQMTLPNIHKKFTFSI